MKVHTDTQRNYRKEYTSPEEYALNITVKETDLYIVLPITYPEERAKLKAWEIVLKSRHEIEAYIALHPEFYTALLQDKVDEQALPIVKEMQKAGKAMGVGAFAAVAGAIAQETAFYLQKDMKDLGLPSTDVLVENGGDVFILSEKKRVIAVLDNPLKKSEIGIAVSGKKSAALCSSSAYIGHSKSFGKADLVMVKAESAYIADAAATAYGNIVKSKEDFSRLEKKIKQDKKKGIQGVLASCQDAYFVWGELEFEKLE